MRLILAAVMFLAILPAALAVVSVTNVFNVNNVNSLAYNCLDAGCNTVGAFSGSYPNGQATTNGQMLVRYPTTLATPHGYAIYFVSPGYVPMEYVDTWYGTGSTSANVDFYQIEICRSQIDSFTVTSDAYANAPMVISTSASLDAITRSAFTLTDTGVGYVPPSLRDVYYSADVRVDLRILDSSANQVFTDFVEFSAANGNPIFADSSAVVQFNWTPPSADNYTAIVETNVIDNQCADSEPESASEIFTVHPGLPRDMCYSILNGLTLVPPQAVVGENVTAQFTKISNHANDYAWNDVNYLLAPVPTQIDYSVTGPSGVIASGVMTVPANANEVNPETIEFDFIPVVAGSHSITVTGIADSGLCSGLENDDDTIGLNFNVNDLQTHIINFQVLDGQTGNPLPGASIDVASTTLTTGADGRASTGSLSPGSYLYTISAAGFVSRTATAQLNDVDLTIIVVLQRQSQDQNASVTFIVTNIISGNPIANAAVTFRGTTSTTSAAGSVTFSAVPAGTHGWFVDALGYNNATGNVTTDGTNNVVVPVSLTPLNGAPVLNAVPDQTLIEDTPGSVDIAPFANDPDGDALTFAVVGENTAEVDCEFSGSVLQMAPAASFVGPATCDIQANDGTLLSNIITVNINVIATQDAPQLDLLPNVTIVEDAGPGVFNLTPYAHDPDGDPLTPVVMSDNPAEVACTVGAGLTVVLTPAANYTGNTSCQLAVFDGTSMSPTRVLNIEVLPVQDAPVAVDDNIQTTEDTPITFDPRVNDIEVDGETLTITLATNGSNGIVTFTGVDVTYTPDADFFGNDSFTYTITDGIDSDSATVFVEVLPQNDDPVANDDFLVIDEDTNGTVEVLLNDTDADGDSLTVTGVTQGTNGAVTFTATNVTYVPIADFWGNDSFTYDISDGNGGTDTATVWVTVLPIQDAPVANDDYIQTNDSTPITYDPRVNDVDVDGDVLTITLALNGTNGTVTFTGTDVTYTPAFGFVGNDSFDYTITDGNATDTATVFVEVLFVNDGPIANDDFLVIDEDTNGTVDVLLNDTDPDGDTLTVTGVTQGLNGTVTFTATNVTYVPEADFYGNDSFTYDISDGNGGTDTATVWVTVLPIQDAPVANDDYIQTTEDTPITFDPRVNDIDVDGDVLTITLALNGTNGTVTFTGVNVTYTPFGDFFGNDSFDYTITDGNATDTATVFVEVLPQNDDPVANDDYLVIDEDTNGTVEVLLNDTDADGDSLTVTGVTQGLNGTVTFTATNVTYVPVADFWGNDSFTYDISDGNGGTATATVWVTVLPIQDAPVAYDDYIVTDENQSITYDPRVNDIDVDGDVLTITDAQNGTNGTVTFTGLNVTYTPEPGFFGNDSFDYTITDGNATDSATIFVTVNDINFPPEAYNDSIDVLEDSFLTFDPRINDSDPDGDPFTITAVTQGANGTVTFTAVDVTYTPDGDYFGADLFSYTIDDGNGTSTAWVNVNVIPVNDEPEYVNGSDITVLEDSDDFDELWATAISAGPANEAGQSLFFIISNDNNALFSTQPVIDPATGNLSFSLAADEFGNANVTVRLEDDGGVDNGGDNATADYTFAINVLPVNDEPSFFAGGDVSSPEDTLYDAAWATGMSPGPANEASQSLFFILSNDNSALFSVQPAIDATTGNLTFMPGANLTGTANVTVRLEDDGGVDNGGDNSTATVQFLINITNDNDAPVANDDSMFVVVDTVTNFDPRVNDTDPDGDTLTITAVTQGANGTVGFVATMVTYTPDAGFIGNDTFTYTIDDGNGGTDTATIYVTVGADDPMNYVTNSTLDGTSGVNRNDSTSWFLSNHNVYLYYANLTDSDIDDAGNTNINYSVLVRTIVRNSWILNSLQINDSNITNSILDNCIVENSTVKNIVASNCEFRDSLVDPPSGFNNLTGSVVENSSVVLNSNVTYSFVDNSTIEDSDIDNSTIRRSTLTNVTMDDSTVTDSDVDNSTVADSTIDNSDVTDSDITGGSLIEDSTVDGSAVDNSNVTDGSTVTDSDIADSNVENSDVTDSDVTDSDIVDSTVDDSTVDNSNVTDSDVTGSDVTDSDVTESSVTNSTIDNSTLINATIVDTTVDDSHVEDCDIYNSFIDMSNIMGCGPYNLTNITLTNATIINGTIINGTITWNNITTPGPANMTDAVNFAPHASFTASATSIRRGRSITFTDTSTDPNIPGDLNDTLTYYWTFGSAGNSTLQNPVVTFDNTGNYDVRLVVTDRFGYTDYSEMEIQVTSSGGGGGGGGGIVTLPLVWLNITETPTEFGLTQSGRYAFMHDGIQHNMTVPSVGLYSVRLVVDGGYLDAGKGTNTTYDILGTLTDLEARLETVSGSFAGVTLWLVPPEELVARNVTDKPKVDVKTSPKNDSKVSNDVLDYLAQWDELVKNATKQFLTEPTNSTGFFDGLFDRFAGFAHGTKGILLLGAILWLLFIVLAIRLATR